MIRQLPKVVQSNPKTLFTEKKGTGLISDTNACVLLSKVKELMSDCGIPLDIGCRRLNEISEQSKPSAINVVGQSGACRKELRPTAKQPEEFIGGLARGFAYYSPRGRRPGRQRGGNASTIKCHICNKPDHLAADCTNQYCQVCSVWGHGIRKCNKPSNRYGTGSISEKGDGPDETVIVSVEIEGQKWEAMLDSGAGISVTDIETLTSLGLDQNITTEEGNLRAFDNDVKQSIGYIHLNVGMGSAKVNQKFKVVKSQGSMTIILGRDFLYKFGSTEFDWLNGRVRLGKEWLQPQVWIRGGEFHERIAVATQEVDTKEYKFDINPEFTEEQKGKLLALLSEYSDCFAPNPKKPTFTSFGEHVIDTVPGSRPVQAERFRMLPQQEEEVNMQVEQMVKVGNMRPSNSP